MTRQKKQEDFTILIRANCLFHFNLHKGEERARRFVRIARCTIASSYSHQRTTSLICRTELLFLFSFVILNFMTIHFLSSSRCRTFEFAQCAALERRQSECLVVMNAAATRLAATAAAVMSSTSTSTTNRRN